MHIGELLNTLAIKAGIKADDPKLISLLSANGLRDIQVPDDLATQIDNSLLTVAAATNNHPAIKNVYFSQALNGLDAAIKEVLPELGFDDTNRAEIEGEKSSIKRAIVLAKKAAELAKAKAEAEAGKGGKVDDAKIQEFNAKIVELNQKLAAEIQKQAEIKGQYESKILDMRTQQHLGTLMAGYKTVYDDLPAEAKSAAMRALLENEIQAHQAKWAFTDNGEFTVVKNDGTTLISENHTPIKPQMLLDKAFAKILKQTEGAGGAGGGQQFGKTTPQGVPGNTGSQNAALAAKLSAAQSAYDASVAAP